MPKQYLEIKKSYLKRGKSLKTAKKLAAMTYNARHPGNPMSPKHSEGVKRRLAAEDAIASDMRGYRGKGRRS